ncbi:protein sidekick isoform X3 [Hydra vulgaris]|uniref:Protein sidekick isoform X3 n=1 Tax=Hydra vulgaris TaxID=6087 RepID=A0ABM4DIB1_HYDVU
MNGVSVVGIMLLITLIVGLFSPFTAFSLSQENLPKITSFQCNVVDVPGIKKSKRLELECIATGKPEPDIEFQLNGANLINGSRVTQISKNKIIIDDVTYQNDDGKYKCVAINDYGRVFTENEVKVKTIGKFDPLYQEKDRPIELKVKLGLPKEVFCPPHSYAYPKQYLWSFGTRIQPIKSEGNKILMRSGSGLFFSVVTEKDIQDVNKNGLRCILKMGEVTALSVAHNFVLDGNVTNESMPTFHVKLPSQTFALQGQEVTLLCVATGNPQPEIKWFRNGALINGNDSKYVVFPYQSGKLTIKSLDSFVEGQYKCLASNKVGQVESIGDVLIAIPVSFNKSLIPTVVVNGGNVSMECSATGTEPIVYEWYRNGSLLTSYASGNYSMVINGGKLEISSVQFADAGSYQCFVSNKYGQQTSATILTVKASNVVDPGSRHISSNNNVFPLKYIIIIACATASLIILMFGTILVCRYKKKYKNHKRAIYVPSTRRSKKNSIDLPSPPKSFTEYSDDEFSSDSEKPVDFIDSTTVPRQNYNRRIENTVQPNKDLHIYCDITNIQTENPQSNSLTTNQWRNSTPSAIL